MRVLVAAFLWAITYACFHVCTAVNYTPKDSYSGATFFSGFNFNTFDDPTHGYVDFVNETTAIEMGLINVTADERVYIGTEYAEVVGDNDRGRKSIRLQSKESYNGNILIVIDLEHMPTTVGSLPTGCASWPAFWTVGPDWPSTGEIDIIEYINTASMDITTLHTDEGCDQSSENTSAFTGQWSTGSQSNPADDCNVYANDQWANQGCGIIGNAEPVQVGAAFNDLLSGGVYALEWSTDEYIRAFYFERSNIPVDIIERTLLNPDKWGTPYARFELGSSTFSRAAASSCTSDHFSNHSIIFDNTFCGDWAGSDFTDSCSGDLSCTDYVKYNPSYFEQSYWLLNYVDVYQKLVN